MVNHISVVTLNFHIKPIHIEYKTNCKINNDPIFDDLNGTNN